jgi:hypothetical protein
MRSSMLTQQSNSSHMHSAKVSIRKKYLARMSPDKTCALLRDWVEDAIDDCMVQFALK